MHIRPATQSDAEALGPLIFSTAPATISAIFEVDHKFSAHNFLLTSLNTADGQYGYGNHWVAEIDKLVVGCISAWHRALPEAFHQATLSQLASFYGLQHTLPVARNNQVLRDCIPKPKAYEWCVGHFAVEENYRKRGIGRSLLDLMRSSALAFGKSTLSVDVESSNTAAITYYQEYGFIQESGSGISPNMQSLGIGSYRHLTKPL